MRAPLEFVALLMVVLSGVVAAQDALAAKPSEWATKPYDYLIVDQDLRTVLEEFGRNNGLRTSLSSSVQGRVKGNMPRGSARAFLDALTRAYGLDWYFDGSSLSVTTSAEARSRFVELHGLSFEQVLESLSALGVNDDRFQLRRGPSPSTALVSGPPRYIEAVSDAIAAMTTRATVSRDDAKVVRVYRGGASPERIVFSAETKK